jgi:hypothetical protein
MARCRRTISDSRFSGEGEEEAELTDMLSELDVVAKVCATLFLILCLAEGILCGGSEAVDMFPVEETDAPPTEAPPTEAESSWVFAQFRCRRERCSRSAKECLGDLDGEGIFSLLIGNDKIK